MNNINSLLEVPLAPVPEADVVALFPSDVLQADPANVEVAPGVTEQSYTDARLLCEKTTRPSYSKNEAPDTLLPAFDHIAEEVKKVSPYLLQDLISIVNNTDDSLRRMILENMSHGLIIGPKVLRRFTQPLYNSLHVNMSGEQHDEFLELTNDLTTSLGEAYSKLYLQGLSTFAGLIESPDHTMRHTIFEGSKKERSIGFDSIEDAMYALKIANKSLFRVFTTGGVKKYCYY